MKRIMAVSCVSVMMCVFPMRGSSSAAGLAGYKKAVIARCAYEQFLTDRGASRGQAGALAIGELDGKKVWCNPKYFVKKAMQELVRQLEAGGITVVDQVEAEKACGPLVEDNKPETSARKNERPPADEAVSGQQKKMREALAQMEPKLKEMEKTNPEAAARIRAKFAAAMGDARRQIETAPKDDSALKQQTGEMAARQREEERQTDPPKFADINPQTDQNALDTEAIGRLESAASDSRGKRALFADTIRKLGADVYVKASFNGGIVSNKTTGLYVRREDEIVTNKGYMALRLEIFTPEGKSVGTANIDVFSAYSEELQGETFSGQQAVDMIMNAAKNVLTKRMRAAGLK